MAGWSERAAQEVRQMSKIIIPAPSPRQLKKMCWDATRRAMVRDGKLNAWRTRVMTNRKREASRQACRRAKALQDE